MIGLSWRELRTHPRRLAAVLLAVSLGVGFLAGILVFTAGQVHSVGQRLTAATAGTDVVAEMPADRVAAVLPRVRAMPGVAEVATTVTGYSTLTTRAGAGSVTLRSRPTSPAFRTGEVRDGSWPQGAYEVVLSANTARSFAVRPGDTLTLRTAGRRPPRAVRVVGLLAEPRALLSDSEASGVVDPVFFTAAPGIAAERGTLLVRATPGASPDALVAAIRPVAGDADAEVETTAQRQRDAVDALAKGADLGQILLLCFGAIALLVAAMLIANTYAVLLGTRRRTIGLLRAVGASTAQIRRGILLEAGLIGAVGAVAGVLLGIVLAAGGLAVTGAWTDGLVLPPGLLLLAAAVGLTTTVLAALGPAVQSARTSPLEALSPVPTAVSRRRSSRWRWLAVSLLVAVGAVLLGFGLLASGPAARLPPLSTAVAGSALVAVGVLAATPLYLPGVLRGLAAAGRRAPVVARLAGANLSRNPQRASATCVALMLAAGLVVTVQVGAATVQSTVLAGISASYPVDVTVGVPGEPLPAGIAVAVAGSATIRSTTVVTTGTAYLVGSDREVTLNGVAPDAAGVVRRGLEPLHDGVVLIRPALLADYGLADGSRVALRAGEGRSAPSAEFTVRASKAAAAGTVVVTSADLQRLLPEARPGAVWAAARSGVDPADVLADVRGATSTAPGLFVEGALVDAADYTRVVDVLLVLATALLGVAVVIALIGVGNTLSLSVLERGRESALLRALGLSSRALRGSLAVEGVVLALLGATVGALAGVFFGTVGAAAVAREVELGAVSPSISIPQTATVLAVAVVAGVLASVLPGRLAARAAPVTALAEG